MFTQQRSPTIDRLSVHVAGHFQRVCSLVALSVPFFVYMLFFRKPLFSSLGHDREIPACIVAEGQAALWTNPSKCRHISTSLSLHSCLYLCFCGHHHSQPNSKSASSQVWSKFPEVFLLLLRMLSEMNCVNEPDSWLFGTPSRVLRYFQVIKQSQIIQIMPT